MADLTPRQRDVLELRAAGMSVSEAAAAMGISFESARAHGRDAYARLGASSLAEALLSSGLHVTAAEHEAVRAENGRLRLAMGAARRVLEEGL